MPSTTTPDSWPDFQQQLLAVRRDPEVKRLALRCAGVLDLAEDALDEAYCAVARVRNPQQIKDLQAYFCRALINAVNHLRYQLGATLIEDFERVAGTRRDEADGNLAPPRPFDETVSLHLLAQTWLGRFAARRTDLRKAVPGRSPDPDRYRDLIVTVAARVLRAIVTEDVSDADSNQALRAVYPEWFAEDGCEANNAHQRFSRARTDVRDLLKTIIDRDDLYS